MRRGRFSRPKTRRWRTGRLRELLAKIIVEAGQRGESDQARLVAHALDRFGEEA
jgi:hypothetical protein